MKPRTLSTTIARRLRALNASFPQIGHHASAETIHTHRLTMNKTLNALTQDAKKHLKEAGDYQAEADKAWLAAGVVLRELKARITNKESDEGKEWGRSWPKFVKTKLKGECSYSHAQRLIVFAESKNPKAAIANYRKQDAAKKRERRDSQTSENAGAAETK